MLIVDNRENIECYKEIKTVQFLQQRQSFAFT